MKSTSQSRNIAIILVEPQMGENIGATARAMKNFNLHDLRIVNPRDGWPNDKANSMSVGAIDIIHDAKIYSSVESAIADLEYVYAATATRRDINKNYVLSRDLSNEKVFSQETESNTKPKIGIMFGRENSGLNNKEISVANKILTIDTDVKFSSLNIASSVAIICYELFQSKYQTRPDLDNIQQLATNEEKQYFYDHLFSELDNKGFFKITAKTNPMKQKISNIFARIDNLSQSELQTLRGIVKILSNH